MKGQQYLEDYCMNHAERLRRIVDKILHKYQDICIYLCICQKDYDDFYSLAGEVLWETYKTYDGNRNFTAYLYSCLDKKIKTELTRRNREKRQADRNTISIDMPVYEDKDDTIGDLLASDDTVEKEVFGEETEVSDTRIQAYLDRLSIKQRQVVILLSVGYKPSEIKEMLHITGKVYSDCIKAIQSYENIKILL